MKLRAKYSWAWILWVLGFAVIEFKAITDDDKAEGDFTLSHYIRRLLATKGKVGLANWGFRAFLLGLFTWLIPHFNYFGLIG